MSFDSTLRTFSRNRLKGEPVPDDLKLLLGKADELFEKVLFELNGESGWAPWLDTSYLSEEERVKPDIVANLRAIEEVCDLIAFVGAYDDAQYLGYWRGPTNRKVADSPLVFFDNEGQFEVVPGSNLAEAILWVAGEGERVIELRDWMRSIGIDVRCDGPSELTSPNDPDLPGQLHNDLFHRYRE
jgi:hypothetical protein